MAYEMVSSRSGEYAVDWETVERLVHSYYRAAYTIEMAETKVSNESSWYNPLSWALPDVKSVEVPWDKVDERAALSTYKDMMSYASNAQKDMRAVAYDISGKVAYAPTLKRNFINYCKSAQTETLRAMESSISDYDGLIEATKFVRDTSADVVAIGATMATGGAAAGLLGASSAMKGYGKYQDTGKAGVGVLYGVGSLVFGAFKVGKIQVGGLSLGGAKYSKGEEYALIIAQGVFEGGASYVSGKSFKDSVGKGALKIASAGSAQALFNSKWVIDSFAKAAFPFDIMVGNKEFAVDMANKFMEKFGKKMAEKAAKPLIGGAYNKVFGEAENNKPSAGLVDEALLHDDTLLKLAIVNTKMGVGRGW